MTPENVTSMVLYAWVGEDEFGSGEVGLKQALVPAGMIPLVACKDGKINSEDVIKQLQLLARTGGKTIRLCKFTFESELLTLSPR